MALSKYIKKQTVHAAEHEGADDEVVSRPPYVVKGAFVVGGLILRRGVFLILKSTMSTLVQEEQARVSQDFVEGVVDDFGELGQPLNSLAELVALSGDVRNVDKLAAIVGAEQQQYKYYDQVIWFYKNEKGKWAFSNLLEAEDATSYAKRNSIEPNAQFLKLMIEQGVHKNNESTMPIDGINFQIQLLRQSPRLAIRPVVLAKAIPGDNGEKGFLLSVINVAQLYDDGWIGQHRHVSMMRIHDIQANRSLYEFDRYPNEPTEPSSMRQVYEFPFGGRTLEVAGVFKEDTRSSFLSIVPYVAAFIGVLLTALGTFFIHSHQRQSEILREMNEVLEDRNFALKNEAEERERLNRSIEQTEHKTRAVIDAVNDIIFEADSHGKIIFLNKAWQTITGFEVEQTKGQHLKQLLHLDEQDQVQLEFRA